MQQESNVQAHWFRMKEGHHINTQYLKKQLWYIWFCMCVYTVDQVILAAVKTALD